MKETINTSVLVIDDEEMVRDNIEDILSPKQHVYDNELINTAASILFDKPQVVLTPTTNIPNFIVHKAANGMEGLEMVKNSIKEKRPYAVIFLDMRMPGWDGLETAMEIRKYDNKAEIIFITAYSDRSINEIVAKAGQNIGYHCKPYASEEIIQLATKAVTDYGKLRNLERLIEIVSSINLDEHHLNPLLNNILDQLALYMDTDMALLGKIHDDHRYEKIFSIGAVEEKINIDKLISRIKDVDIQIEEVIQLDDNIVLARLEDYSIFAILKKQERLKTEKLYLLKLFVQNAAKAVRNASLQEKLLQKEKLSAVGKAVSMIMHDLRSPVTSIKLGVEMMREEGLKNEWLDIIDTCGTMATEIFQDFIDFINDMPIKKMPVKLNDIINDGITMAASKCNMSEVAIMKDLNAIGIIISGDKSKLSRVIMNLVNNAVDALLDNKISSPAIHISTQLSEDTKVVNIQIKDNGPGIPEEITRTIFEPFITKNKSNGTGLGLAIVKQYIVAHNGDVWVTNNEGAIFNINLPVAQIIK
ncbi:MAG: ATP-binding protein [Flavipsychrobacter sp.]